MPARLENCLKRQQVNASSFTKVVARSEHEHEVDAKSWRDQDLIFTFTSSSSLLSTPYPWPCFHLGRLHPLHSFHRAAHDYTRRQDELQQPTRSIMADLTATFRTLINSFTDFLTVAIHLILYERAIYPQTSFLSARKYNFAVRQNRHPKVCEWINDAIAAVEAELLRGAVDRVVLVIYSKYNKPLERYVFDASRLPQVSTADADTPLVRTEADGEKVPVLPLVDMEEQFRGTLSRLAYAASKLKALPTGCTFTVAIELKDEGEAPIRHPQPWMPVQPALEQETGGRAQNTTRPVRTVSAGEMTFEAWIEEAGAGNDEG